MILYQSFRTVVSEHGSQNIPSLRIALYPLKDASLLLVWRGERLQAPVRLPKWVARIARAIHGADLAVALATDRIRGNVVRRDLAIAVPARGW